MENQITLPAEVAQIAESVSVEKRNEVQTVLNQVFNGVAKMREQLDGVTVSDPNDKVNMKLANTIRLGVRQVRLEAEKTFDAKRTEVQAQMLSYKTEDQLWLKAKQTMQILTKEIEEQARWKEETRERFESEQKELKIQQRILRVSKVAPEMLRQEFESMSDETFELFFAGIEKAYNDKIEAEKKAEQDRIEKEQKDKLRIARRELALPFLQFWSEFEKDLDFAEVSESDFNSFMERNKRAKVDYDIKQEQIRLQNQKLAAEKKAAEEKAKKEKELADKKLKDQQESARVAAEKAAAEKKKLEADLKAKTDAEEKARNDAEEKKKAEEKAKVEAEKAPDKDKLTAWVNSFSLPIQPNTSGQFNPVKGVIDEKFQAFKAWAVNQIKNI